ncbi:MAG: hypothetical protein JO332_09270 [Planctomycetaceae bacterium]|nr:hypothetical protein [Planctomycetaceae bacterium]
MDRFEELLSDYQDGRLDPEGRRELGLLIDRDPVRLEAFLDAVREQRILRLERY